MPIAERLKQSLADRYRIDREIGAGGMATVYLAHDLRHDRPVALKIMRPELPPIELRDDVVYRDDNGEGERWCGVVVGGARHAPTRDS